MNRIAALDAYALARKSYETPEVRFLSQKQHGAFILAVMNLAFPQDAPVIADHDLHDLVDRAAGVLRDAGEGDLPVATGRALAASWVAQGWLEKDRDVEGVVVYRPSSSAQSVMSWLAARGIDRPISAPRVNQIFQTVAELAQLADPDRERMIEHHDRKAEEHRAEAERLRAGGELEVGTEDQLRERVGMVARDMEEIPADFRRVGEQFKAVDRRLRHEMVSDPGPVGAVISQVWQSSQDITRGTPAGRSFIGVADLISDQAQMAMLRENVQRIMASPAGEALSPGEQWMFANLPQVFTSNVQLVMEGPQALTRLVQRRLAAHVTSTRQEGGVEQIIRAARAALQTHQGAMPEAGLPSLGMLRVAGSSLRLHDPRPPAAPRRLDQAPAAGGHALTLEYLRRWGGPQGTQVADHVTCLLEQAPTGKVTLAQAWQEAPADLRRSVELIAYLGLPTRTAGESPEHDVVEVDEGDQQRMFRIPRVEFTAEREET